MSKYRVLLVDDDDWQLDIYERFLNRAGYACYRAKTPNEAIEVIDEYNPDVIVLDALLEGNTAFVLLNEMQSDSYLSKIPVIMSTNIAQDIAVSEVQSYGVKRVLDKSTLHPSDIVSSIRAVLS
ncbi:response regulator [Candidatus Saccharibacteria bacterium]|jgi:DNA-binding response OmpR family regulator|nr:response regulator [Candidatus Saccharibacteria bacterium]